MSLPDDPLVSIVTPVYNGADYLRECLESVLAQSYTSWRCTVVNNCSTDGTLDIAREFAARDARVRVLTNERFLPLIANHNHALTLIEREAQFGKPLMADDWLAPTCLERLVASTRGHPTVGLVCCAARTGSDRVLFDNLPGGAEGVTYLSGRDAARLGFLEERYFFGSPTTMLMRADLIRKRAPFYNPENFQADEEACYDLLRESDFAFVHEPLAFVRMHARSHTSTTFHLFSLASCHTYALARYGPYFLTGDELRRRLAQRLREYYSRLALGVLERRDDDFWEFHRRMLGMIGHPLNRSRLAVAVAVRVLRRLASPRGLGQRVLAHLRIGKRQAPQ
ncbi:MAG: glycosyltransferase family 2 protein [Proteobacteria bacterium]|nr:glycosyltransferase family 2 protein [Pseudomonadota bacterium]